MISDKTKKQNFAMTPDIHTKTYAERSGLGGIASANTNNNNHLNTQPSQSKAGGIHSSAKVTKNGQMMGMTTGGQGQNASSMMSGIGQGQQT